MLAIKLKRVGRRHQPSYRLVVAEKKSKMGSPPVEDLGFYDPLTKALDLKKDRIGHWLAIGAKPTVTIHNLLVGAGILSGGKMAVKMKSKKTEGAEKPAEAPKEAPVKS